MCAADAFQQQSGDLGLSVKLCLRDTELVLSLQGEVKGQEVSKGLLQTPVMVLMKCRDKHR